MNKIGSGGVGTLAVREWPRGCCGDFFRSGGRAGWRDFLVGGAVLVGTVFHVCRKSSQISSSSQSRARFEPNLSQFEPNLSQFEPF